MLRRTAILVVLAGWCWCEPAFAQAWVPDKGEGTISVLYQDVFVKDHFMANGQRRDQGSIDSANLVSDVTYGVTDRLAVTLAVPFVSARYSGGNPHPTEQDDGATHAGFQDVRFSVRYNVSRGALAVTPFVGTSLPTHAYEYFAHASYGPRMRELEVGTYVGYTLDAVMPNAFVQARYAYSFPEEIAGVKLNRSNLSLEFGYFITPKLRVFTLGSGHKTHGGIDLPAAGWRVLPAEQGPHHDRVGRIDLLNAGGGVQVSLNDSFDLFGSYMTSLAGANTHALARAITVGASWSFGRGLKGMLGMSRAPRDTETSASAKGKRLVKCLCQK